MLSDRIFEDYKAAMKAKDELRVSVLSFLRSEMLNLAKDKKQEKLADEDVISVIKRLIKQHKDSIEQFEKGSRQDLADKERAELKILELHLPAQMSPEELDKIIREVIGKLGAAGIKDMGKAMKEVMVKCAGCADGKTVSDKVKSALS